MDGKHLLTPPFKQMEYPVISLTALKAMTKYLTPFSIKVLNGAAIPYMVEYESKHTF